MRAYSTLADDLLGRHASADLARRLVRALPLHVRAGLSTSRRTAALVAATVAIPMLLLSVLLVRSNALRAPAPVAELMVLAPRANGLAIARVPLLAGDWVPWREIVVERMPTAVVGQTELLGPVLERAGHRGSWLYSRPTSDSGAMDLSIASRSRVDPPARW